MNTLLTTLHAQHRAVATLAAEVSDAVAHGDCDGIQRSLHALRAALGAHLALEDAELYPALSRAAEQTGLALPTSIARTYEHNMTAISTALTAFLDSYHEQRWAQPNALDEFRRDWALVSQLLADRINSEETTLYPLYASWVGGPTGAR